MAKQQNQNKGNMQKAKAVKEGQVKKNKPQNAKNVSQDKVAVQNKNGKNAGKPMNKNQKPNNPQEKGAKISPASKKNEQKKKKEKQMEKDEESDEDINEGVVLPEETSAIFDESMMSEGEDDDSSSEMEEGAMKLLGESLADNSDSDDEDFAASGDETEEKNTEKKGVKAFKGMKASNNTSTDGSAADEEDEDDDDDDEDDDDDDEEDDDDDDSGPGLKTLMGSTIDDDADDEDFDGAGEDDEDEDIDESEEDDDNNGTENEMNESTNSATSPTKVRLTPEEKAELDQRTIFIGNVPKEAKESKIRTIFGKFGKIETLRVRGIVPESPKMSMKLAAQKKKIHPKVKVVCVFIAYEKAEFAKKALAMNGKQFEGNYLRVDMSNQKTPHDPKKTVFLGNLPFETEDNELWTIFGKCGPIESVRTVRDRFTGACRGIGYVNFKSEDGVTLALDLNNTKISNREIRVARYSTTAPKKNGVKRTLPGKNQNTSQKKIKTEEIEKATKNSVSAERRIKQAQNQQKNGNTQTFQGQKADAKKKGKNQPSKFEKKKKNMAGQLMAKSAKKPVA